MTLRRRQSVEERKQLGMGSQSRASALNMIDDPRTRRAIDALTSTENFDLEMLGFDGEGRLTVREDAIKDVAASIEDVRYTVETRLASAAAQDDPALRFDETILRYTQLPPRGPVATGTTLEDLVARVNEILVDQRNAGHRARGDAVVSEEGVAAVVPDYEPFSTITVTADYTALLTDDLILGDDPTGSVVITISLPAASTAPGKRYWIKKIDGFSVDLEIDPNGSEMIDGTSTTRLIGTQYGALEMVCDGTEWWIV